MICFKNSLNGLNLSELGNLIFSLITAPDFRGIWEWMEKVIFLIYVICTCT